MFNFEPLKAEIARSRALNDRAVTLITNLVTRKTELEASVAEKDARIVELEAQVADLQTNETPLAEAASTLLSGNTDFEAALNSAESVPVDEPVTRLKKLR
jgi:phage shock protein A